MMRCLARLLAAALVFAAAPANAAEPDLAICMLCHGTEARGNAAVRAPRIAGMEAWYLKQQLDAYRANLRGSNPEDVAGQEMRIVALSLGDEAAVDRIVTAIANMGTKPTSPTIAGDTLRGKELYASCAACHGPQGEGKVALKAPALANGSDWYQVAQLENFMQSRRGTHLEDTGGLQMRAAAAALPDAQAAHDVVAYINTLRPGVQLSSNEVIP